VYKDDYKELLSKRLERSRLEPQRLIIIITLRLERMLKSQSLIIIITLRLEHFRLQPQSVIIIKMALRLKHTRLKHSRLKPQRLTMLEPQRLLLLLLL
jgi:hypothetical protein